MAELIAAIVPILVDFLRDVNGLLDPAGATVWLSVNHRLSPPSRSRGSLEQRDR